MRVEVRRMASLCPWTEHQLALLKKRIDGLTD